MRKPFIIALACASAMCVFGQTPRDGYRNAYRAWRESDPNLEHEAASGSASIPARADRAAALAAKYGADRKAYLERFADEYGRKVKLLEAPPAPAPEDWDLGAAGYLAEEAKMVRRNMDSFTDDPDAGLRRLRGMLVSEDQALNAVSSAAAQNRKVAEAAKAATAAADQARLKALKLYQELGASLRQNSQQAARESAEWADYYRSLADAGRPGPAPVEPTPATSASTTGVRPRASLAPLPLVRYTGAWTFPANGAYHGLQPELIDMLVHEEGGRAEGTLFARFKGPPGSRVNPEVRFDFAGDFRNTRNQVFAIDSSDGTKGRIELIPGAAFNLLEINFLIEAGPAKIRQGNAVLIKK